MLSDARDLPNDSLIEADVCIIGGGPAGIVLALELQQSGLRTVLLESGGTTGPDPATQRLHEGESVGEHVGSVMHKLPLDAIRLRWLGGTTNHWAGYCRKLEPVDFEQRDHLEISGWPIERAELEPYWQRAASWCHITDSSDDPEQWRRRIGLPAALPATAAVHTKAFQIAPLVRFGEVYLGDLDAASDVETVLWANATDLASDSGRSVSAVHVRTLGGNRLKVQASAYVLAAGGLENPRLLLASTSADPAGLGNGHDQVGRYFCEHLQVPMGFGVLEAEREELLGYVGTETTIRSGRFAGRSHGVKYTLALTSEHVLEASTLGLEAQFLVEPLPVGVPMQTEGLNAVDVADLVALTADRPPASGLSLQAYRRSSSVDSASADRPPASGLSLQVLAEQRLRPDSRVTLSARRDALGMRRIRLDWRYGPSDRAALVSGLRTMAEELGAMGLGRLQVIPGGVTLGSAHFFDPQGLINLFAVDFDRVSEHDFLIGMGYHHMCTTRMSETAERGVVNSDCRVHEMDNLWIAGSSVFATGGVATPTFTIVALAIRLADHLKQILL